MEDKTQNNVKCEPDFAVYNQKINLLMNLQKLTVAYIY